jgi:hypothetical protein
MLGKRPRGRAASAFRTKGLPFKKAVSADMQVLHMTFVSNDSSFTKLPLPKECSACGIVEPGLKHTKANSVSEMSCFKHCVLNMQEPLLDLKRLTH